MLLGVRVLLPGTQPSSAATSIMPDELARALEDRGFESLWLPEHTHLPVETHEPPAGGPLPSLYQNCFDPLITLTSAATATSRLRLGTGVCLVAQRDPFTLAKQVATLDVLSRGRVVLGVGFGWNRPELAHHGVPWSERRNVAREHILAMKALWTEDVASFDGQHVTFGPSWSWPKPNQSPHPPVLLGARASRATFLDVARYADGWLPNEVADLSRLDELRRVVADHGRDPEAIEITLYGVRAATRSDLTAWAAAGVTRVVLWLSSGGRDEVLRQLDSWRSVVGDPGRWMAAAHE